MERWHILLFGLLFTWILPIVVAATMLGVITLASGTVFLCRIIVRAWGSSPNKSRFWPFRAS